MSLDAAEHLPENREASFVEDRCELAPFVCFSDARTGRPGMLAGHERGPRMPHQAVHPEMIENALRPPHSLRPWVDAASEVVASFPTAMGYTWGTEKGRVPVLGEYLTPEPEE